MRIFMVMLLALALLVAPAAAQAPDDGHNQIVVRGTSRVEVAPTQAVVTVGIQVQRPTAAEASAEAARVADQILTRLRALGLRSQDLRTSGVQLQPIFNRPAEGAAPQIVAYRATNMITVTANELRLVGPVIDESVKAGATTIFGVSFGLRDPSEARRDALSQAVREAREKAEVIARAAGLTIKGIERIVEEGVDVQIRAERFAPPSLAPAPIVPTPVEPGVITVTATVSMVFTY